MKYLKSYEEITPVVYVAPEREHPSYKSEEKKKKKKKSSSFEPLDPVMVPPNHTKDAITFKAKP